MNTKYKDSVFTKLFNDEDSLRELYTALKGIDYDPAIPITINTLEDVLYMDRINDLSFTVGDKLVFVIEHQSTLNKNMPLRFLSYIPRVYEKIIARRAIYKNALVKIPKPEFVVLYNGLEKMPEKWELRLSNAFTGLEAGEKTSLDLIVTVYNINYGQNMELLRRSENLAGYAQFVAKVRENAAMPLEQAVTEAIRYCIKNRILARFLEEYGSEVTNMMFGEWDWDEAKEAWQEEAREEMEAKYQPILIENRQALAEKDCAIQELRRKLQEAGIDS
ncbi:Rpn family recombination-promoting nuclease/putative transposase [Treponema primitia]|uniref:Rpn family recombination-promoting nuclease/putative transposase n=1 Tax=Treponema primitia TaxID=88058 RepID=UPI001E43D751|nr:Rpn family recombination-promoting nuclease/putative transposase [Treponema primitia]